MRLRHFLAVLVSALVLPVLVFAQTQDTASPPNYDRWDTVATSAQKAVQAGKIDDTALTALRKSIDEWRQKFTAAEDTNATQISTVKAQIDALGPPPKEGETENPDIAKRRKALNDQLAQLQAPSLRATEAASRADAIIANIDKLMRARQTDKLLRLTPTPLNPVNWPDAAKVLLAVSGALATEFSDRLSGPDPYATLRNQAPVIAALVIVALILVIRGRRWIDRLAILLERKLAIRARRVIDAVVSLGQLLLPILGMTLLVTALRQTDLFGPIWDELLLALVAASVAVITAIWLAGRVFPRSERQEAPFNLVAERRREGRFLTVALGILMAVQGPFGDWIVKRGEQVLTDQANTAAAADNLGHLLDAGFGVMAFPLQVLAGLMLFRMGQLLRRHLRNETSGNEEGVFRDRIVGAIGSLVLSIGVVGPLLGAIGYVNAANALIWPTVLTLGLMALVLVIQKFCADLYVFVTRRDDEAREALIPSLIGFGLGVLALPVAALIWGAQVNDLKELWIAFRSGISVGGVKISPGVFLTFAVLFMIGLTATRLLQGALKSSLLPKTRIDKGGQNAIVSGVGYLGIFLAAVIAISSAGIDLSSLAIVAGALSVGVGFGLQTIVQNFVSGIILLIERPISEGDWIEVGGQMGVVKSISVRSTRIETFDRTEVIVPNADLISGQVTNWTRGNLTGRLIVPVGVAYGVDTRRVEQILLEIANAHPLVMMKPEPTVIFAGFGDSSLNFEIRVILSDVNFKLAAMTEMNHQIAERFASEGIEIPFPQRDLWLRNPEQLRPAHTTATTPGDAPRRDDAKFAHAEKAENKQDKNLPGFEGAAGGDPDGDGGGGDGGR